MSMFSTFRSLEAAVFRRSVSGVQRNIPAV